MAVFNVNFPLNKKSKEKNHLNEENEEKDWNKFSTLAWIKKYNDIDKRIKSLKNKAEFETDDNINKIIEDNKLFFKILIKDLIFFVFIQAYFLLRPTLMTLENHLSLFFTMDGYKLLFKSSYHLNIESEVHILWSVFLNIVIPVCLVFLYANKTLKRFEQKISMESEILMIFSTIKFIILNGIFLITSLLIVFEGTIFSYLSLIFNITFAILMVICSSFSLVMPFDYITYRKNKIKKNVWSEYKNLKYEKNKMKEDLKSDDLLLKMLYINKSNMSFKENHLYNKIFEEKMNNLNIQEMQKIYFERIEVENKNELMILTE